MGDDSRQQANHSTEQGFATSLRSNEPDLEITVRNGDAATKVFHHYSVTMASFYGFFDSLLASGMQEAQTMKVTLEDVDPDVFELATAILANPKRARNTSAREAIQVAPFYHKYDSELGLELVEEIICLWFDDITPDDIAFQPTLSELETVLDALVFAKDAAVPSLISKGKDFVRKRILSIDSLMNVKMEEYQIKKLLSFIVENMECYQDLHNTFFNGQELPDFRQEDDCDWFMSALQSICKLFAIRYVDPDYRIHVKCTWKLEDSDLLESSSDYIEVKVLMGNDPPQAHNCFYGKMTCKLFEENIDDAWAILAPCALLKPKCGIVGTDYSYSDWAAILTFPNWNGNPEALVLEFVWPLSGNQFLPPLETAGWRLLNPLDDGEISMELEKKYH